MVDFSNILGKVESKVASSPVGSYYVSLKSNTIPQIQALYTWCISNLKWIWSRAAEGFRSYKKPILILVGVIVACHLIRAIYKSKNPDPK